MAKLDDLLAQIQDIALRGDLEKAVDELRRRKTFGLVFEEHIPEITLLRDIPLKPGATVYRREDTTAKQPLVVTGLDGDEATVATPDGEVTQIAVADLVVLRRFGDPVYPALTPIGAIERSKLRPYHAVIEGENYHALQLLTFMYEAEVDCIYIDPPYNTGSRDWKYNNNYVDTTDSFHHSKWLSMMEKRLRLAKRLLKPDGVLICTIDEHEVHHLGVLLEQVFPAHLRYMINIVINPKGTNKANFGRVEEHAFFVVPKLDREVISAAPPPSDQRDAEMTMEAEDRSGDEAGVWVRELAAGKIQLPVGLQERLGLDDVPVQTEITLVDNGLVELRPLLDQDAEAASQDVEKLAPDGADVSVLFLRRRGAESSFRHQRPNQFYAIKVNEATRQVVGVGPFLEANDAYELGYHEGDVLWVYPIDEEGNERVWRYVRETMEEYIAADQIRVGTRWENKPQRYTLNHYKPREGERLQRLRTTWWRTEHDAGTHGTTLLSRLLGEPNLFPFPKSLYAVRDCVDAVVRDRPDALILDFFAGSGTTLHAVALINQRDGGQRRCVLVTNNEVAEKTAKRLNKTGLYPGDPEFDRHGIFEAVTRPRINTALTGTRPDGMPVPNGKGYRYLDGRPWAEGFDENCVFLRMDYLEPDDVELGQQFAAVVPILWLASGGIGPQPDPVPTDGYLIPASSSFAVLLRESAIRRFTAALEERPDVTHVWIVTDSERAFADLRAALPGERIVGMLYRDYLRTFAINTLRSG
jgi:adenine-specific DNA-methyltransferase